MQPLSAPISDLLFLPYLFHLECKHPTVYFREKEMQNQRHEVCLKYIGSNCGASIQWPSVYKNKWRYHALGRMEYWNIGILEYWSNVVFKGN